MGERTVNVSAVHHQFAVFDPGVIGSYPLWETGEERLVQAKSGIAVATETDGDIEVVVQILDEPDDPNPADATWIPVGHAEVTVRSGRVAIGNVEAATMSTMDVAPGTYEIEVFRLLSNASRFLVWIQPGAGS